jgi:archaellum biogenesis protein FlaJ (TadC family)
MNYKDLKQFYAGTGINLSFEVFIIVVIVLAIGLSGVSYFLVEYLIPGLQINGFLVGFISFIAIASLALIIPISIRNSRIESIEQNLPDALKHMSLVLKAGGTTETSLEEVSNADYGPLSAELRNGLKALREGKSFDEVMMNLGTSSGSQLFMRVVSVVVDARKAGAGLADVLNAIAEDARDVQRIKRERVSRSMMHIMFLIISGFILAPFIFGFVITIINFMSSGMAAAGTTSVNPVTLQQLAATDPTLSFFLFIGFNSLSQTNPIYIWRNLAMQQLLLTFLVLMSMITLVAIGLIREGSMFKYIIYAPFTMLLVVIIFTAGKIVSSMIIGGAV